MSNKGFVSSWVKDGVDDSVEITEALSSFEAYLTKEGYVRAPSTLRFAGTEAAELVFEFVDLRPEFQNDLPELHQHAIDIGTVARPVISSDPSNVS